VPYRAIVLELDASPKEASLVLADGRFLQNQVSVWCHEDSGEGLLDPHSSGTGRCKEDVSALGCSENFSVEVERVASVDDHRAVRVVDVERPLNGQRLESIPSESQLKARA
jgi:hypothetical protein